jgi:hypothetical protein
LHRGTNALLTSPDDGRGEAELVAITGHCVEQPVATTAATQPNTGKEIVKAGTGRLAVENQEVVIVDFGAQGGAAGVPEGFSLL